MKTWQKIVGILVFTFMGIVGGVSILQIEEAYLFNDLIGDDNRVLWDICAYIEALVCVSVVSYIIALYLLIKLWRKGGRR